MKRIRLLVAGLGATLIAVGYLASQVAFFNGQAPDYAKKVDGPQIVLLALVLFLTALGFLFAPDREEAGD
jgi:hypothetical protein